MLSKKTPNLTTVAINTYEYKISNNCTATIYYLNDYSEPELMPILIFSPARNTPLDLYHNFVSGVADNGYFVIGLNHKLTCNSSRSTVEEEIIKRIKDVELILDMLLKIKEKFKFIDIEKIGIFGHSLGGALATLMCCIDHKFQAGLNLDGALVFLPTLPQRLLKPLLLISSKFLEPGYIPNDTDLDQLRINKNEYHYLIKKDNDNIKKLASDSNSKIELLVIKTANHWSFSDLHLKEDNPLLKISINITHALIKNFFNHYLKKDDLLPWDILLEKYPELLRLKL